MRRAAFGAAIVLALGLPLSSQPAFAFCYGASLLETNRVHYQTIPDDPYVFTQETTFWAVFAAMPFDEADDADVELYDHWSFAEPQPLCLGGYISGSNNFAGRTDFIIADFNNTPLRDYYPRVFCYSGNCNPGSGEQWTGATWRPGEFIFVDFPPTTVSFGSGNPVPGDRIIKVFDVFLSVGTTYNFRFTSSMGTDAKMLLFRNPSGGSYIAGRNAAQFEATGCTNYTAPASGYYGLVVVLDRWTTGSYTVGVTTVPSCACADSLPAGDPVAAAPTYGVERRYVEPRTAYWNAVGVRAPATADWDLEIGDGNAGGDGPACQSNVLANSVYGTGAADIVVGDYNYNLPSTLAVRAYRYSGATGASLEWDTSSAAEGQTLYPNGPQVSAFWGASDVVEIWDAILYQGTTYTFQFYNPGGNFHVLLFRNAGNGAYFAGRADAVLDATSNFSYIAPSSGYYGVAVVKDDDNSGIFALRIGTCSQPTVLAPLVPAVLSVAIDYGEFTPTYGSWTAVGVRSTTVDWDILQYGTGTGAAWPDCYSPAGASSEGSSGVDFVVGDFHFNPPGTYHTRVKQFTGGSVEFATTMWTGPAKPLVANHDAAPDTMRLFQMIHTWEVYLVDGAPYEIRLAQPAGGSLRAYLFVNAAATTYWAPRSARLLETGGIGSFVAPSRGWYAIVVADDNNLETPYTLQIVTTPTAVDESQSHFATELAGAVPNPARSDFAIRYSLARSARVGIQIVDVSGRLVADLDEGVRAAGEWSVAVPRTRADGTRLPAGVYFARMRVDGLIAATRKVSMLD